MNAQQMRSLVEEARAGLANGADETPARTSSLFDVTPERDREFRAREKIRREIIREQFGADSLDDESAKPALADKLARLLRLS